MPPRLTFALKAAQERHAPKLRRLRADGPKDHGRLEPDSPAAREYFTDEYPERRSSPSNTA